MIGGVLDMMFQLLDAEGQFETLTLTPSMARDLLDSIQTQMVAPAVEEERARCIAVAKDTCEHGDEIERRIRDIRYKVADK